MHGFDKFVNCRTIRQAFSPSQAIFNMVRITSLGHGRLVIGYSPNAYNQYDYHRT
jgi:hypothetical protein